MASNNEIIVRIVVDCAAFTISFITTILAFKFALARSAAAHKREIADLRERIKIAEDALEKIDNMCDGDMCKYFEKTHHCSACRYLESCQTGVAHAALAAIHEKGVNNGK